MADPGGTFKAEQTHNAIPAGSNDKKRSRVQFSCTTCRQRKLKCDRAYPCGNCTRRGDAAACTYVGRGPKGRASHAYTNPTHIQNRIHHLENLVLSFAQKRRLEGQVTPPFQPALSQLEDIRTHANGTHGAAPNAALLRVASNEKNDVVDSPGRIVIEDVGTSYIDAAHWRAILEEINEVKKYLREDDDEVPEDSVVEPNIGEAEVPTLLLGLGNSMSLEDLIEDMPPKRIADRLVSRCLNSRYPALIVIHLPTFQKEYAKFWQNPQGVSVTWLGLLYACMSLAVAMYHRTNEQLPETLGTQRDILTLYKRRAAQCLVLSNYTKPGRYKVETLVIYCSSEMLGDGDPHSSICYVLAMMIKLAMRMGYHRDSKHFPKISAYEGEMRRRVWALLCQFDSLTSCQGGLPKNVQSWQFDTELPHNLLDEDFDEDSTELPPSRPETEYTSALYTICKARIMSVFGEISDLAYSRKYASYDKILEVDKRLEEAYASVPPSLRIRAMGDSITDSAEIIMRRHTLVFLYNKGRVVLHRKYLTENRSNPRYGYSHWVCIKASKEILRRQADIYYEVQPGGQLYQERWFISSLQIHDFQLAALIICLELIHDDAPQTETSDSSQGSSLAFEEKEELLHLLEMSQRSFKLCSTWSTDARKAYETISVMLRRARRDQPRDQKADESTSITTSSNGPSTATISNTPSAPGGVPLQPDMSFRLNSIDATPGSGFPTAIPTSTMLDWAEPLAAESLGVIENMLETPNNIDWALWDGQMQGIEREPMNYFWGYDSSTTGFH